MYLPWYVYMPVVAGLVGAYIGGRIYKNNKRKQGK